MSTLRSKDRASLCSFTFADGRECRTLRFSGHPRLCCFHARKEAQAQAAESIGHDISSRLSGSYLSACDLSPALGQVFTGVTQGSINRKIATNPGLPRPDPAQFHPGRAARIHQRLQHGRLARHHPFLIRLRFRGGSRPPQPSPGPSVTTSSK